MDRVHRLQFIAIDDLKIFDTNPFLVFTTPPAQIRELSATSVSPGLESGAPLLQCAIQQPAPPCVLPAFKYLLRELSAKTVRLANRRNADDVDREIQIRDHSTNDRQLLHILFTEIRAVGPDNIEKLQHDRRNAAKMTGPEFSAQMLVQSCDIDERQLRQRIHFVHRRRKNQIDAVTLADLKVLGRGRGYRP